MHLLNRLSQALATQLIPRNWLAARHTHLPNSRPAHLLDCSSHILSYLLLPCTTQHVIQARPGQTQRVKQTRYTARNMHVLNSLFQALATPVTPHTCYTACTTHLLHSSSNALATQLAKRTCYTTHQTNPLTALSMHSLHSS